MSNARPVWGKNGSVMLGLGEGDGDDRLAPQLVTLPLSSELFLSLRIH